MKSQEEYNQEYTKLALALGDKVARIAVLENEIAMLKPKIVDLDVEAGQARLATPAETPVQA